MKFRGLSIVTDASSVAVLRLSAIATASGLFGLAVFDESPNGDVMFIALLAVLFAVSFTVGSGYRILIAVAVRDGSHAAPASWAGGVAATALLAVVLAVWRAYAGSGPFVPLAAFAVAINAGFIPAKLACRQAGCCGARLPFWPGDVRLLELILTGIVLLVLLPLWLTRNFAGVALAGIGGHLAIRLLSYRLRHWLPAPPRALLTHMQDIVPLGLAAASMALL